MRFLDTPFFPSDVDATAKSTRLIPEGVNTGILQEDLCDYVVGPRKRELQRQLELLQQDYENAIQARDLATASLYDRTFKGRVEAALQANFADVSSTNNNSHLTALGDFTVELNQNVSDALRNELVKQVEKLFSSDEIDTTSADDVDVFIKKSVMKSTKERALQFVNALDPSYFNIFTTIWRFKKEGQDGNSNGRNVAVTLGGKTLNVPIENFHFVDPALEVVKDAIAVAKHVLKTHVGFSDARSAASGAAFEKFEHALDLYDQHLIYELRYGEKCVFQANRRDAYLILCEIIQEEINNIKSSLKVRKHIEGQKGTVVDLYIMMTSVPNSEPVVYFTENLNKQAVEVKREGFMFMRLFNQKYTLETSGYVAIKGDDFQSMVASVTVYADCVRCGQQYRTGANESMCEWSPPPPSLEEIQSVNVGNFNYAEKIGLVFETKIGLYDHVIQTFAAQRDLLWIDDPQSLFTIEFMLKEPAPLTLNTLQAIDRKKYPGSTQLFIKQAISALQSIKLQLESNPYESVVAFDDMPLGSVETLCHKYGLETRGFCVYDKGLRAFEMLLSHVRRFRLAEDRRYYGKHSSTSLQPDPMKGKYEINELASRNFVITDVGSIRISNSYLREKAAKRNISDPAKLLRYNLENLA